MKRSVIRGFEHYLEIHAASTGQRPKGNEQ